MKYYVLKKIKFIPLLIILIACSSIDVFNQKAYEQATSIKVEALSMIENAINPYPNYDNEVKQLQLNAKKAYEYARGRNNNEESIKQWEIMINPERHMLFGFIKRWESDGQLSQAFIEESKKIISEGFDTIIELESGKRKQ